ncbi:MAG: hypothetical protein EZS28_040266 [Streblomastix strix]|uniref:Tyr recombinase domain-containing protein n=1 Tax=Streblomastix strix TaxID=222440 RepID=A0A5J4U0Y5_9EUKA|nr:MAG: hypothetical protein EZS28_040266 [Streblomastix strix]
MRPAEIEGISLRYSVICEKPGKIDLRLQPKPKSGLHSHKLPKARDQIMCPRATFFDWLKRIDNKHSLSIRNNKYGALRWNEYITILAKSGQISLKFQEITRFIRYKREINILFRHQTATQIILMGIDETLLNANIGNARNSKSTTKYYEIAERLQNNEITTNRSDTHDFEKCNLISSTQQR